ncbi:hypothetical protein M422DRAFT_22937 [Sphaerobolus stellatus SS14]|nr:hypothetical protein M422DRAFT_22937 [Sphaerobolus stellatus SS14]
MSRKALLVVDVQYDFLPPDGSLAVPRGDTLLPFIYDLLERAQGEYDLVIASLVRHPVGHVSFASTHSKPAFTEIEIPQLHGHGTTKQMLWPDHCIQGSHGSEVEKGIKERLDKLGDKVKWVKKGSMLEVDAYSAFADNNYNMFTSLAKMLHQADVSTVDVVGLALDYCVRNSVIDARKFGFKTRVFKEGTRPVDPTCEESILGDLEREWGVEVIS